MPRYITIEPSSTVSEGAMEQDKCDIVQEIEDIIAKIEHDSPSNVALAPLRKAQLEILRLRTEQIETSTGLLGALVSVLPLAKGYRSDNQSDRTRRLCQRWITDAETVIADLVPPKRVN